MKDVVASVVGSAASVLTAQPFGMIEFVINNNIFSHTLHARHHQSAHAGGHIRVF
jgi:hypothetical protein